VIDNPLLERKFEIPFDRIEPRHVEPAVAVLIARAKQEIEVVVAVEGPRTYDNTVGALDRATEPLEYAVGVVGHLESVATTDALRDAYTAVQPAVAEFYSSIPLHPGLWRALQSYASTDDAAGLDPTRSRHLDKLRDDFRRHGAELGDEDKKKLSALDVELAQKTTKFSQNVLDATNAWDLVITDEAALSGLPESAMAAAAASAQQKGLDGWRFTLQAPSYIPLVTYLDDAAVREEAYRAFNTRASSGEFDNASLLADILRLRSEKARLLGYANFADFVLEDRMAKNAATARTFLHELRERSRAAFVRENEELLAFRRELEGPGAPELQPWDVAYVAEKQRRARYSFDEEALRPYFAVDAVLGGLFGVVQRLYGVRIESTASLPVWHESVRVYRVREADGTDVAAFYVDVYPRETKRDGAWMNGLITGVAHDGGVEPHLGLICGNVMPPVGDRPALLRHDDVEMLFHEFGHLMHHCLSRVTVRSLGGTNVAWDFVELPSQIMENWCWEREALDLFARHWQTGEPIPQQLFEAMQRARTFRAANAMMRQLGFAEVDLALHVDFDPDRDGSPVAYARRLLQDYAPAPLHPGYAMITSFSHLFANPVGYAAGYYSYKWAEVLDADGFTRFREEGIFSPKAGMAFRDEILARGDSRDPMELFVAFMGRPPRVEPLLERSGLQ
jgi:oligopeptidase A